MRDTLIFFQMAAAMLLATNVSAQVCYLSTECEGDAICVNKSCEVPEQKQASCTSSKDCESEYYCESDVCKPNGVACQNDNGFGIENATFGLAACTVGVNSKWMADMDCMPGAAGCDFPSLDQMTDAELEDEYQDCMTHLEDTCDIDAPAPGDVCDADSLEICTAYVTHIEGFQSVCAEDKGMGGGDDSNQVSGLYAVPKFQGLSDDSTDYHIGLCCEELEGASELDSIESIVDCMDALAADDCDGVSDCNDMAPNRDDTYGADDKNTQAEKDSNASTPSQNDSDPGCTLVNPGASPVSLLGLLLN